MDTNGENFDGYGNRRYGGVHFSPYAFMQAPISVLLEYAGDLRNPFLSSRIIHSENDDEIFVRSSGDDGSAIPYEYGSGRTDDSVPEGSGGSGGEISIRIIEPGDRDVLGAVDGGLPLPVLEIDSVSESSTVLTEHLDANTPSSSSFTSDDSTREEPDAAENTASANSRDGLLQSFDLQQMARWAEKFLPFSLLLLVVFIRQHLQGVTGFFLTLWIAAVMFKSNDILRKQTALKGERKVSVLVSFTIIFALHVVEVYWWYRNDGLINPLFMVPPKVIPPFWHAVFIVTVNDTMVRQAAMVVKCMLLLLYRDSRGRSYRRQGQMLTLVEYLLLLYRALLPAPVWYRFFLNKEYGSLFSSLTTGLYLTFKLTSVVEKVQSFYTAFKALSRKEVQYGSYATPEQVIAAGDLCAICQEKMHAPILLRCKHIFCEDCVSEWFERERTCPLCRALVKSAELKSYGDGSTSLFFQLF